MQGGKFYLMYSFSSKVFASLFNQIVKLGSLYCLLKEDIFVQLTDFFNNKPSLDFPTPAVAQAHGINRKLTDALL
jgi:hypothetical protein